PASNPGVSSGRINPNGVVAQIVTIRTLWMLAVCLCIKLHILILSNILVSGAFYRPSLLRYVSIIIGRLHSPCLLNHVSTATTVGPRAPRVIARSSRKRLKESGLPADSGGRHRRSCPHALSFGADHLPSRLGQGGKARIPCLGSRAMGGLSGFSMARRVCR